MRVTSAAAAGRGRCPPTRARTRRSKASRSTRSPARAASAASSSAASIAASSRGASPTRPADGARGVEHEQHPAVALGPPGAHHDVAAPRGGPPVDRAHVVAVDVLAQRVELGALPAHAHAARPSSSRSRASRLGQVLARGERRQHPQPPRHRRPTAAGRPGRAARASGRSPGRRAGRRAGSARSVVVEPRAARRRARCSVCAASSGARPTAARRRAPRPRTPRAAGVGDHEGRSWPARRAAPGPVRRGRARERLAGRPASSHVERRRAATARRAATSAPVAGLRPHGDRRQPQQGQRDGHGQVSGHQRGTGTEAEHAVEHPVGGHALELGLGAQRTPGAAASAGPAP